MIKRVFLVTITFYIDNTVLPILSNTIKGTLIPCVRSSHFITKRCIWRSGTLVTKGKTLVTKGKTLVTKGKTLVTKEKTLVTKGKDLGDQKEDLGDRREDLGDQSVMKKITQNIFKKNFHK